jgi:hypothetical protein
MPPASRVNDKAKCPSDSHGKQCCSHSVTGPAVSGSPDVFINGQPVLRIGDPGEHSSCAAPIPGNARKAAPPCLSTASLLYASATLPRTAVAAAR